jgi:SAM-dependent methyltransferase
VYDDLDPDRSDLEAYVAIAQSLDARTVLDIGCGTGSFALMLADEGMDVIGLDPAAASLAVARGKPGAERVRWIPGDARALPPLQVDLATMTANVAQAIVEPDDWHATLAAANSALRPGGWLVFETRVPSRRAWENWNPIDSRIAVDIPGIGRVESWEDVVDVSLPLVSFRSYTTFESDGTTLVSDSTLRFREQDELCADLVANGFGSIAIGEAPDRPGREWVFRASKLGESARRP